MEWSGWGEMYANRVVPADVVEHLARAYTHRFVTAVGHPEVWSGIDVQVQRQYAEHRASREHAQRQAEQLLRRLLSPMQVEHYRAHLCFRVRGSQGGLYEIAHGYSGNVYEIEPSYGRRYCAHPPMNVPVEAAMVGQLLMINTDESGFLRVAIPQ